MGHAPKCVGLSMIIHNRIVPRKAKGWEGVTQAKS